MLPGSMVFGNRPQKRGKASYLALDFSDTGRELACFGRYRLSRAKLRWIWSRGFYSSPEWKELRYRTLRASGGRCMACGRSAKENCKLNVDHIRSRRRHPHLALSRNNLQVLCADCNRGKGGQDATDWRGRA